MPTIKPVTEPPALYCRYPNQSKPQPCFVELDCQAGTLSASHDPEIGGGVPMAVHHGHVLRWVISPLVDTAANALLSAVKPYAEVVIVGYESTWDGQNHVARYSAAANVASASIEYLCDKVSIDDGCRLVIWEAAEWFGVLGDIGAQARELDITAETTDVTLEAIAKRELSSATTTGDVDDIEGLSGHLEALRAHCRKMAAQKAEAA